MARGERVLILEHGNFHFCWILFIDLSLHVIGTNYVRDAVAFEYLAHGSQIRLLDEYIGNGLISIPHILTHYQRIEEGILKLINR